MLDCRQYYHSDVAAQPVSDLRTTAGPSPLALTRNLGFAIPDSPRGVVPKQRDILTTPARAVRYSYLM